MAHHSRRQESTAEARRVARGVSGATSVSGGFRSCGSERSVRSPPLIGGPTATKASVLCLRLAAPTRQDGSAYSPQRAWSSLRTTAGPLSYTAYTTHLTQMAPPVCTELASHSVCASAARNRRRPLVSPSHRILVRGPPASRDSSAEPLP